MFQEVDILLYDYYQDRNMYKMNLFCQKVE